MHYPVIGIEHVPETTDPPGIRLAKAVVPPEGPANEVSGLNQAAGLRVSEQGHIGQVVDRSESPRYVAPLFGGTLNVALKVNLVVDYEPGLALPQVISNSTEHFVELGEHLFVSDASVGRPPPVYDRAEERNGILLVDGLEALYRFVRPMQDSQPRVQRDCRPRAQSAAASGALDLGGV